MILKYDLIVSAFLILVALSETEAVQSKNVQKFKRRKMVIRCCGREKCSGPSKRRTTPTMQSTPTIEKNDFELNDAKEAATTDITEAETENMESTILKTSNSPTTKTPQLKSKTTKFVDKSSDTPKNQIETTSEKFQDSPQRKIEFSTETSTSTKIQVTSEKSTIESKLTTMQIQTTSATMETQKQTSELKTVEVVSTSLTPGNTQRTSTDVSVVQIKTTISSSTLSSFLISITPTMTSQQSTLTITNMAVKLSTSMTPSTSVLPAMSTELSTTIDVLISKSSGITTQNELLTTMASATTMELSTTIQLTTLTTAMGSEGQTTTTLPPTTTRSYKVNCTCPPECLCSEQNNDVSAEGDMQSSAIDGNFTMLCGQSVSLNLTNSTSKVCCIQCVKIYVIATKKEQECSASIANVRLSHDAQNGTHLSYNIIKTTGDWSIVTAQTYTARINTVGPCSSALQLSDGGPACPVIQKLVNCNKDLTVTASNPALDTACKLMRTFKTTTAPGTCREPVSQRCGPTTCEPNLCSGYTCDKDPALFLADGITLAAPALHGIWHTACGYDYLFLKATHTLTSARDFCCKRGMRVIEVDTLAKKNCFKTAMNAAASDWAPAYSINSHWYLVDAASDDPARGCWRWCQSDLVIPKNSPFWYTNYPKLFDKYVYYDIYYDSIISTTQSLNAVCVKY